MNEPDTVFYFNQFKRSKPITTENVLTTETLTNSVVSVKASSNSDLIVLKNPFYQNPLFTLVEIQNGFYEKVSTRNYWRKINGTDDRIFLYDQYTMSQEKIYNLTFTELSNVQNMTSYSVNSNRIGITWEVPNGATVFKLQFSSFVTSSYVTITETLGENRYVLTDLSPSSPYTFR